MEQTTFILASASPRRKELLTYLSLPHTMQYVVDTDETIAHTWTPEEAVMRLGVNKALAVYSELDVVRDDLDKNTTKLAIIAADTVVVNDGVILGKPTDEQDAYMMLSSLQGRVHDVYTGLSLLTVKHHGIEADNTDFGTHLEQLKQSINKFIANPSKMDAFGSIGEFATYRLHDNSDACLHVGFTKSRVTFRPLNEQQIWLYIKTGDPMDKAGSYGIQGIGAVNVESIDGDFYSVMGLPISLLNTFIERDKEI